MTAVVTFVPAILVFVVIGGSFRYRISVSIVLLPGVLIVVMAKQAWEIAKETIRGYRVAKEIAKATNDSEREELEQNEQKTVAQQQQDKTDSQASKIYEVLGESGPQVILQVAILLKSSDDLNSLWNNNLMEDYDKNPWTSTLLVILSSLLSLVLTGGSMMTESFFVINGERIIPYHSLGFTFVNTVLMLPIIIPRLFGISLIFASFPSWYAIIPVLTGGFLYTLMSYFVIRMFKRKQDPKDVADVTNFLKMMVITSVFLPCFITNPNWNLLNHLTILSGSIICLILVILILLSHLDPTLLSPNMMTDPALFQQICAFVIGLIVLGCVITVCQVWLARWRHQSFFFQCVYGNTTEVEAMLKSRDKKQHNYNEVNCLQETGLDKANDIGHTEIVELIRKHGQACGIPPPEWSPNFYSN